MILERVLRGAAIVIAILGLVDPVLTLPWRESPVVAVTLVDPVADEMSELPQGALTTRDADALKARVMEALGDEFRVRDGAIADAAAVVLIGDGRSPSPSFAIASLPSSARVVAGVMPSPAGSTTRIVSIDAPKRAHISELTPVTVHVEARGLAGRTSTIVAHAAGLEVARAQHKWSNNADTGTGAGAGAASNATIEQAAINLNIPSLQTGPARFTISVIDDDKDSTNDNASSSGISPSASADIAVDIHNQPLRVLFVNGRPSWATRFIERALDGDPRFDVSAATRVSRGLTATSAGAPASLATSAPDSFHAIVLGAPELVTKAEADLLRAFVRVRGGLLIVAPDRMLEAANPVLDLLPARKFTERLLDEPAALAPLFASEFAIPEALLPGADTLLRIGDPVTGSPAIVGSPLGEGYAIVSGALDAWRYRDRAQDGFDRFWRDTISARAATVPDPIEITLAPLVTTADTPISVHVRVRSSNAVNVINASGAHSTTTTIAARVTPASAPEAGAATSTPIRLWPDARPSAYHGAINAPSQDGVYAVSVQLDGQSTPSRASFRVQHDARIARPAWPGLQAFVEARRGLVVTSDHLDRLIRHLRESIQSDTRQARHPLRSVWWILPFAACLGGEWLLRRRRGER